MIAITSESAGCLRQAGQILADIARSDAGEFEGAGFAPGQELPDGMEVSPTRMFIADRAEEEFLGREYRRRAGPDTGTRAEPVDFSKSGFPAPAVFLSGLWCSMRRSR